MKRIYRIFSFLLSVIMCLSITEKCYASEGKTAKWPTGPDVASESAIIMEASTGAILYQKKINQKRYPASITKILTTLLAIENSSLDDTVTFSKEAVFGIERNSSHIARDVGEELTMEQCLYAIMLESANEVSAAVAEHVSGSIEGFSKLMNEKAKELGCKNTHFNNPHGLPDENHYTTAYDMALIAKAAINNDTFKLIAGSKRYTLPPTNKNNETFYMNHHHKMLQNALNYEGCEGGKTGYTSVAGATLVTFAKRGDLELICVVMKASGSEHYEDTAALFDYAFKNFELYNIADNDTNFSKEYEDTTSTGNNDIFGDIGSFISVSDSDCIVLPKDSDFSDAIPSLNYNKENSDVLATLTYEYDNHYVGSTTVKLAEKNEENYFKFTSSNSSDNNESKDTNTKFLTINILKILTVSFLIVGVLFILFVIFRIINSPKSRRKRRRRSHRSKKLY